MEAGMREPGAPLVLHAGPGRRHPRRAEHRRPGVESVRRGARTDLRRAVGHAGGARGRSSRAHAL